MFVRRFLQITQAKQLDVKKNAHIATGVMERIYTVHTTKSNRHNRKHRKRIYPVLQYKTLTARKESRQT